MKIDSIVYRLMTLAFFLLFAFNVEGKKKEVSLTPVLRSSVSYKDKGKITKLKKKALKTTKTEKKLKYYMQAAQLGDYESQVRMGYYYGFCTFDPSYVDFDPSTMDVDYSGFGISALEISESVARYYLNAALRNEDVGYYMEQATLGLIYLSLDSIDNPAIARRVYEDLITGCAIVVAEYLEENRNVNLWPYARRQTLVNTGKLLSTLYAKGIGIECDLISAHYYSLWVKNEINMPNSKVKNEYTAEVVRSINNMPFSEEGKQYGVGLASALLLKRAADIYAKSKNNPEIIFWIERSLEADSTNSDAYYLSGCLYLNGDAGLLKSRKKAKEWYSKGANLGSNESVAALASIEEIEAVEYERQLALSRAREKEAEAKRQRRRQMWAQAIGAIIQAAGNAYMVSQGYASNSSMSLLDPNLAIQQVQEQNAQMAYLQQLSMQNFQMPQFDLSWPTTPQFTVDWKNVDWTSASMDTYYLYQGDLINNGATSIDTNSSNNFPSSTGNTYQEPCRLCHGLGNCWTCNGKRTYQNPLTSEYQDCPNCTDGLCSHCHGSKVW